MAEATVKNAELVKMREVYLAEKQAIETKVAPARAELDRLTQNPRIGELRKTIIDSKPRMLEIDNHLAALARALGPVKSIAIEPGVYSKKE